MKHLVNHIELSKFTKEVFRNFYLRKVIDDSGEILNKERIIKFKRLNNETLTDSDIFTEKYVEFYNQNKQMLNGEFITVYEHKCCIDQILSFDFYNKKIIDDHFSKIIINEIDSFNQNYETFNLKNSINIVYDLLNIIYVSFGEKLQKGIQNKKILVNPSFKHLEIIKSEKFLIGNIDIVYDFNIKDDELILFYLDDDPFTNDINNIFLYSFLDITENRIYYKLDRNPFDYIMRTRYLKLKFEF